jgi:hypothetical protein
MLVNAGLVSRRVYGEIPLYTIDGKDSRARVMIEFFAKIQF